MYPREEPAGYVVGFSAVHSATGRATYRDSTVSYAELGPAHANDDVVQVAWGHLKVIFQAWKTECDAKQPLVGQSFTPTE